MPRPSTASWNESSESARLDALYRLGLLDTPPSESFDRITRMASQIFDLPIAAVSLTDRDRQWFKSRVGVQHDSIPRENAPCAHVAETTQAIIIPDLLADDCYASSNLARTGARFYAGAPLVTREGFGLGALCVIGVEPREAKPAEMAALTDLAAMVMSQIELQHAFGRIDPQSGLPNRHQFLDDVADLARDKPGGRRLVVLIDLARAEQINAIVRVLGNGMIDEMVEEAARTLRAALPQGRLAYHVAATQFAFLADPDLPDDEVLRQVSGKLAHALDQSNVRFVTSASIGIAPFILGQGDATDVLRTAHSAAQDARASDTAVSIYSVASDDVHRRRFRLMHDFGVALADADRQLRIVVQPRVDLTTGACVGAEVLLRWRHPELGDISPAEFIPIVERSSMARATTKWVLEAAISQLAHWQRQGLDLPLSVNVSATNLEESDFAATTRAMLFQHKVRPGLLELEVTESAIMTDAAHALEQLNGLHDAGIRIAIDDFGTGYSSLAYLQQLPASVLKIDQSFVRDCATGERQRALVRSMVTLSHDLGFRVVAEGIEDEAVALLLRDMGCDEAQGFHYARPMEVDTLAGWMRDWCSAEMSSATAA